MAARGSPQGGRSSGSGLGRARARRLARQAAAAAAAAGGTAAAVAAIAPRLVTADRVDAIVGNVARAALPLLPEGALVRATQVHADGLDVELALPAAFAGGDGEPVEVETLLVRVRAEGGLLSALLRGAAVRLSVESETVRASAALKLRWARPARGEGGQAPQGESVDMQGPNPNEKSPQARGLLPTATAELATPFEVALAADAGGALRHALCALFPLLGSAAATGVGGAPQYVTLRVERAALPVFPRARVDEATLLATVDARGLVALEPDSLAGRAARELAALAGTGTGLRAQLAPMRLELLRGGVLRLSRADAMVGGRVQICTWGEARLDTVALMAAQEAGVPLAPDKALAAFDVWLGVPAATLRLVPGLHDVDASECVTLRLRREGAHLRYSLPQLPRQVLALAAAAAARRQQGASHSSSGGGLLREARRLAAAGATLAARRSGEPGIPPLEGPLPWDEDPAGAAEPGGPSDK